MFEVFPMVDMDYLAKFYIKKEMITKEARSRKCVDVMIINLLIGAVFVPGGHRQFSFWYVFVIPIAVEMIGLPSILTFWLYQAIFPIDIC